MFPAHRELLSMLLMSLVSTLFGYRILSLSRVERRDGDWPAAGDLIDRLTSVRDLSRDGRPRRHANLELSRNISAVLENLLQDYDNTMRPAVSRGPTLIKTNMLIRSLGPISELDMEYSMDCYFRQMWRDERLSFNSTIDQLSLSITMLERIWKPDTFFLNGRGSYVHTITRPNKLIRLARDGSILYSMRLTIKAKCPMMLQRFPMDQQTCPLAIGSYAYNSDEVRYEWDPDRNVSLEPGIHLSQFDLISYPVRNSTVLRRTGSNRRSSVEVFSVLQVHFNLQRHTGYFLIQVYVPCILIVVLSWVSFWINREATADRVGLGITSVLTLSTISIDTRTSLPKVSYATAMDWFLLTSFGFIIATLLEFASVHYFTKVGSGESQAGMYAGIEHSGVANTAGGGDGGVGGIVPDEDDQWQDVVVTGARTGRSSDGAASRDTIYRSSGLWFSQASSLSHAQSPLTEIIGDCVERCGSPLPADGDCAVTVLPPPPPPPKRTMRHRPRHLSPVESSDSWWSQVVYCLLGSVEYRRQRQQLAASHINSVSSIDRASRLLFPLLFALLNLFYWNLYLAEPPPEQW